MERCNTGTTAQKLTNDLLRGLYERDCLASHSISGVVYNKRGQPKPALPTEEVQAILSKAQHTHLYFLYTAQVRIMTIYLGLQIINSTRSMFSPHLHFQQDVPKDYTKYKLLFRQFQLLPMLYCIIWNDKTILRAPVQEHYSVWHHMDLDGYPVMHYICWVML